MNQENEEPGESQIAQLSELEQEVSARFMGAVRQKIDRRMTSNQMVAFSWNLPRVIVMEVIMMIGHLFSNTSEENVES